MKLDSLFQSEALSPNARSYIAIGALVECSRGSGILEVLQVP